MEQTNLEILDDLEHDMIDCINSSKTFHSSITKDEIALALFRELRVVKNFNTIIHAL